MPEISSIFQRIEKFITVDKDSEFMISVFMQIINSKRQPTIDQQNVEMFHQLKEFIETIIFEIDTLAAEIKKKDQVLISVKHQKLLRTCFQIITSFGISSCLIPGLGISLTKRCVTAQAMPPMPLSDQEKYDILVICTDFLYRSYEVPVLKNIIITFHLSDYLAALIQLAFAPLKKPGVYANFTMTEDNYEKLNKDRQKYIQVYEHLVCNCFQPMLMKELLVLQNVKDQMPPLFARKVIAKEMSRRLTTSGGLLSLIRCFIESHEIDTGLEWKKIDMICKIVTTKHGNMDENEYLQNITTQLKHILSLNNVHYLTTAVSCLLSLYEKYNKSEAVVHLVHEVLKALDYDSLLLKSSLPGTIIVTPQEVEKYINILHACISITTVDVQPFVCSNLYVLYHLHIKSTKDEIKLKIKNIILKGLELANKTQIFNIVESFLFDRQRSNQSNILIEEYNAGLAIKFVTSHIDYPTDKAMVFFIEIFNTAANNDLVNNLFESCLEIFMGLNKKRQRETDKEILMHFEDEVTLLNTKDEKYAIMLQVLSEISGSTKVVLALKSNPVVIINFVESLLLKKSNLPNDECVTIALVLLNTILSNTSKTNDLEKRLHGILPTLKNLAKDETQYISILCKESVSLILSEYPKTRESPYEKALSNIYDDLLPVRAHGIIDLTKLIDAEDPETISKRHYVFCLFQEQLKDTDSYIYLSAINGIASLATHCTSDVLSVLCKEFINSKENDIQTQDKQNKIAELRMKIGDIIVKVTKRLGEMAIVHKATLLNTMLCACRDEDPLIRASALSNLAEIALVLNYKIGSIIYEVLLCVWSIIESDEAIECRRAGVMVISSLLKGLGKETLVELKENLLPVYKTLNKLYKDPNEDSIVRLHAQIALEELNDIVKQFIFQDLPMEKPFLLLNNQDDIRFK